MFAIQVLPAEISRAEKLLGITTKSLQMSRQRQIEIDETLRQALLVGLAELEQRHGSARLALAVGD